MFFEQEIEQLFTGIYVKTLGHSNNILEECLSIEKARVAALEAASRSLRRLLFFFCFFSSDPCQDDARNLRSDERH